MTETIEIQVVDPNGLHQAANISFEQDYPQCRILLGIDDKVVSGNGTDFFMALCDIRRQIEAEGFRLHCYGASKNVYPSGMARDMGQGLHAYRLRLGKVPKSDDLVGIFESGDDI